MSGLYGRVALVTGAARGQGSSHAIHLARAGADVILLDIAGQIDTVSYLMPNRADLERVAEDVRAQGSRAHVCIVDVRDSEAIKSALSEAVAELGRLDLMVANAGISGYGSINDGLTDSAWRNVLDVNLTGAWNTCAAALPHIVAGGRGGSIVAIGSVGGVRGIRNMVHYTAAKHGLIGIVRTLALEYAEHSIRVNAVLPTAVNTPMIMNPITFKLFRPDVDNPTIDDVREAFAGQNALPVPWVEPEDVSKAVLFLLSDDARYVTGATLPVDAGALLK